MKTHKLLLILLATLILISCTHKFVKKIDNNHDGIIEKTMFFENGVLKKEKLDKDLNGQTDCIIGYDKKGNVTSVEYDTDNDGKIEMRDEYYNDSRSISFRDDNKDGKMDRSWVTYYSDTGKQKYVEYDLNNDGIIDSKFKIDKGIRENLVNGVWVQDKIRNGKHGVIIEGVWYKTVFTNGYWKTELSFRKSEGLFGIQG